MAEKMVQFDNFQTTFMNQLNNKFNLKIKEMERKLDKKLKEGLEAQNQKFEQRLADLEKQQESQLKSKVFGGNSPSISTIGQGRDRVSKNQRKVNRSYNNRSTGGGSYTRPDSKLHLTSQMSTGSNSHIVQSPRNRAQKKRDAPKLDVKTILSIIPKLNVAPNSALTKQYNTTRSKSPPQVFVDTNSHTKQRQNYLKSKKETEQT